MKTLKEQLKEIIEYEKLDKNEFICAWLYPDNRDKFQQYREMAKKYAKKYVHPGNYCWWTMILISEKEQAFVISEKYRFIQDLIKILP